MGILSWWKGKAAADKESKSEMGAGLGLNGAMEVPRPAEVTVFEFGSAKASSDRVTLGGYCPVSEELEPCRWEILPATGSNPPQFRLVF